LHKRFEGRRERVALLWTDYNNYAIKHLCIENEINGDIVGNGILLLMSRSTTTQPRNLNSYMHKMLGHLSVRTLGKIYHLANRLIPADESVIANLDMKQMIKRLTNKAIANAVQKNKITFGEELYYKFMSKGVITKRVEPILNAAEAVNLKSDAEVFDELRKVCHNFHENELFDLSMIRAVRIAWTDICV
jgi:hypothetical protein